MIKRIHAKNVVFLLIVCISISVNGQDTIRGIRWRNSLSYHEVVEIARKENKYIFLDCYATWCGPCKAMERDVYTDLQISQFMNDRFISVKVQMDTTSFDTENIKNWYTSAKQIQSNFSITAFPSFLFFSPDNKPIHKDVGYKKKEDFLELLKNVFIPEKQYYRILSNYKPGLISTKELKGLARTIQVSDPILSGKMAADYLSRIRAGELSISDNVEFICQFNKNEQVQKIAVSYLTGLASKYFSDRSTLQLIDCLKKVVEVQSLSLSYLSKLNLHELSKKENLQLLMDFQELDQAKRIADAYIKGLQRKELFKKDNILLLGAFTKSSKDIGFNIFLHNGARVNAALNAKSIKTKNVAIASDYAGQIVNYVIRKEEISPYWDKALKEDSIDWQKIFENIRNKYNNEIAEKVVLDAKVTLYKYFAERNDLHWAEYIKYNIEKIQKYGTDTTSGFADAVLLNNFAYGAILLHSDNRRQIDIAIKWMEGVVRRRPDEDGNIDTYANLLYKSGKVNEAIRWEREAIKIATDKKTSDSVIKLYEATITKMQRGLPTWIN